VTGLNLLLLIVGTGVTALVVAGMFLITPLGIVEARPPADGERAGERPAEPRGSRTPDSTLRAGP
jgi:hypothetical protein